MSFGGKRSVVKGSANKGTPPSDELSYLSVSDQTAPVEVGDYSKPESDIGSTSPSEGASNTSADTITSPTDARSSSNSTATSASATDKNQLDNIIDLRVVTSSKWNITLPKDESTPRITSCAFFSNGELLLLDHRNMSFKLFDITGKFKDTFDLSSYDGRPWDMAIIDNNTVAVTIPDYDQMLQFIRIYPKFSIGSSVKFDKACWGVAATADYIYVACHDNDKREKNFKPADIRILDNRGTEIRRIADGKDKRLKFINPQFVAINRDGTVIYVSDWETNTITAVDQNDKIVFQYKSSDLKKVKAMYADSSDNLIVNGAHTGTVHVITAKGKKNKTLLTASDGLKMPEGIAYRPSDGLLVIGCDKNELCVFTLG